jgi:cell filamentation protein
LIQDDILSLVENVPSRKAKQFIKWFAYSDDTIDGKSKAKAYALSDSS